jgi:predicted ATPase
MKLTLRNLGRLREATIDLDKDLILLTGPNNTSKTYVAHALYGFGEEFFPIAVASLDGALEEFVAERQGSGERLKVDMVEFIDRYLPQVLEGSARVFRERLADILAAKEEFVARTEVKLDLGKDHLVWIKQSLVSREYSNTFQQVGLMARKVAGEPVWTFEPLPISSSPVVGASGSNVSGMTDIRTLRSYARGIIVSEFIVMVSRFLVHTHVLTAERAAIQLFSRELSLKRTELVDELLKLKSSPRADAGHALGEMLEQRAQRYPLAIRNSLLIANDLTSYREKSSSFAPLAELLERGLLGGSIRVDENGEMLFHPNESDTRLSLHLASSSVKSLAGLSFFLRHIAEEGQFLIIDEPELNLHPDNQRRVARVLARLVRSGVKVLISTHSDYIIRELNNLIMLSADKDGSVRQRLGYDEAETLSPSQVGAYLFDPERANPIEVTPTGIEVATIDREINALNTASQDIFFSLFGSTGT